MRHQRYFAVEGRGEFPLDMLRYDACWPKRQEDVDVLQDPERQPRMVQLSCWRDRRRGTVATHERWASYGWTVTLED